MNLIKGDWYWIRRADGSLAPYRYHGEVAGRQGQGHFYVGSMLQKFPLSQVVSEALDPNADPPQRETRADDGSHLEDGTSS